MRDMVDDFLRREDERIFDEPDDDELWAKEVVRLGFQKPRHYEHRGVDKVFQSTV